MEEREALDVIKGRATTVAVFRYRQALVCGRGCVDLDRNSFPGLQERYVGRSCQDNHQVVLVRADQRLYCLWFTDGLLRVGPYEALLIESY